MDFGFNKRVDEDRKGEVYGKRPLWQWVLIYVVIGAILYGLIYYLVIAKRGGQGGTGSTGTPQQSTQPGGGTGRY